MLIRIEAPHFVAGLVVEDGQVYESAPVIKYMRGWTQEKVINYCRVKGWKVTW